MWHLLDDCDLKLKFLKPQQLFSEYIEQNITSVTRVIVQDFEGLLRKRLIKWFLDDHAEAVLEKQIIKANYICLVK